MFVLVRALVYASLFIGFLLVFLPARIVARAGIAAPSAVGITQILGVLIAALGGILAISCILAFAMLGRGTPAPFDPPRGLVVQGPYRWIRNPMYLGATLVLLGLAAYYESWQLALYSLGFLLVMHLFAVFYEEPTLRSQFGDEYDAYRKRVGRWWPRRAV